MSPRHPQQTVGSSWSAYGHRTLWSGSGNILLPFSGIILTRIMWVLWYHPGVLATRIGIRILEFKGPWGSSHPLRNRWKRRISDRSVDSSWVDSKAWSCFMQMEGEELPSQAGETYFWVKGRGEIWKSEWVSTACGRLLGLGVQRPGSWSGPWILSFHLLFCPMGTEAAHKQ